MKKLKHIFFDLDHTLWDFDKNSAETLHFLFYKYNFHLYTNASIENFIEEFHKANRILWKAYDNNQINKHEMRTKRIEMTFDAVSLPHNMLPSSFNDEYLSICPTKGNLLPHALEVLNYLHAKYDLHILTNGFEDIQHIKMSTSGLNPFFKNVFTAEKIGLKKPDKAYFNYIIDTINTSKNECVMIGDTYETDILGAHHAEIKAIFFNPENDKINAIESIIEINSLLELKGIF